MFWLALGVSALVLIEVSLHWLAPRWVAELAWLRVESRELPGLQTALGGYRDPATRPSAEAALPESLAEGLVRSGAAIGQWRGRRGYLRVGRRAPMICRMELEADRLQAFMAPYPLSPLLYAALFARVMPGWWMCLPLGAAALTFGLYLRHYRRAARRRLEPVFAAFQRALS